MVVNLATSYAAKEQIGCKKKSNLACIYSSSKNLKLLLNWDRFVAARRIVINVPKHWYISSMNNPQQPPNKLPVKLSRVLKDAMQFF
jgi:hypothetical protein